MAVFPFTVRATDSEGSYADRQFNITVRNSRVERFMIINSTHAYTSPDGTSWTERTGQGGTTCEYGNGFWLISRSDWSFLKSTDGINYNLIQKTDVKFLSENGQEIPAQPAMDVRCKMKFWNGRFWLWQFFSKTFVVWSSADGITWMYKTLYAGNAALSKDGDSTVYQWGEDNGELIIPFPCADYSPATGYVKTMGWVTKDGITFTPITNPTNTSSSSGSTLLNRFNGLWVSFGAYHNNTRIRNNSGSYLYSTDGLNWTQASIAPLSGSWAITSAFYVNGLIYCFAYKQNTSAAGYYWTSADGLTWTQRLYKPFHNNSNVSAYPIFKNGVFLLTAAQSNGNNNDLTSMTTSSTGARLSVDGVNWIIVNQGMSTSSDIAAM